MPDRSYFDSDVTTPLRPQAAAAMQAALALGGNPSSVHAEGRAARGVVEQGARTGGGADRCTADGRASTSSGTEANMLALTRAIETPSEKRLREKLLISAIDICRARRSRRPVPA